MTHVNINEAGGHRSTGPIGPLWLAGAECRPEWAEGAFSSQPIAPCHVRTLEALVQEKLLAPIKSYGPLTLQLHLMAHVDLVREPTGKTLARETGIHAGMD